MVNEPKRVDEMKLSACNVEKHRLEGKIFPFPTMVIDWDSYTVDIGFAWLFWGIEFKWSKV